MGSFAASQLNAMLNALVGRADYPKSHGFYVQLHLGDPGSAGTSNQATDTQRQKVTFGVDASGAAIANTASATWLLYPSVEVVTWVSYWSAAVGGVFLGKDDLDAPITTAVNDTLTFGIGELTLDFT